MIRPTVLSALLLCAGIAANGQDVRPVSWKIENAPVHFQAGRAKLRILATIRPGWHLYGLDPMEGGPYPTKLELVSPSTVSVVGPIKRPEPLSQEDPNFGTVKYYLDRVVFEVPLASHGSGEKGILEFRMTYQSCSETICLPPRKTTVSVPYTLKLGQGN